MRRFAVLLTCALFAAVVGCGQPEQKPPVAKPDPHGEHEEHHHPGPHGGLVAAIGDHQNHLEWTHDEKSGKVQLIVLDADKKKEVPIEMESLVVVSGGKEYVLDAVNVEEGKTAFFESTDSDLHGVIETLSDKITAEVKEIKVGDKTHTNVKLIEDHDHD